MVLPVWENSRRIDRDVTFANDADAALVELDQAHPLHRVIIKEVDPGLVSVVIAGPIEPPDLERLLAAILTEAFPTPNVKVDWTESSTFEMGPES